MAETAYLVVKVDITVGASTTTKIVSDIISGCLQLVPNSGSSTIEKKFLPADFAGESQVEVAQAMGDHYAEAQRVAPNSIDPGTPRVYIDTITIVTP